MIRLLKEHYWQEAYAGVGSIEGHVIVGDKMYVPRVRERLQLLRNKNTYTGEETWHDMPIVEQPLPPHPDA